MKLSPLVGLLGHRQVGKTTILEKICSHYYVVDQKKEKEEATLDPEGYLKKRAGRRVALDECQVVPELFPELKEWVRTHKSSGQFLLSGSVRFTSREAIRESLTGRIVNIELLPLTISEILEKPLPHVIPKLLQSESFSASHFPFDSKVTAGTETAIRKYMQAGGLPGVCFLRDVRQRTQKLEEQIVTLLDRDIRLVRKISLPFNEIRAIATALADTQGLPLDYTDLKRRTGVSTPSIKKVIQCLEAIFMIRFVPSEGGSTRGMSVFFEDVAERQLVCTQEPPFLDRFTHFCYTQFRAQFQYRPGEPYQLFQYRTRGGAFLPLCFRNPDGVLGILPLEDPAEAERFSGTVRSFLSHYSKSKVLFVHLQNSKPVVRSERELSAPIGALV